MTMTPGFDCVLYKVRHHGRPGITVVMTEIFSDLTEAELTRLERERTLSRPGPGLTELKVRQSSRWPGA